MTFYRRKPVIIEAFQYLPDNDGNFVCPDWFQWDELMVSRPPCVRCLMIPYKTTEWRNVNGYSVGVKASGGQTAFRGDWVIRNADGTLDVYHDDAFHENYECDERLS